MATGKGKDRMSRPAAAPSTAVHANLLRQDRDGITVLTLNRPEARNSLSEAMLEALIDNLRSIASDRSVRVLVLAATGPVFSAGHDLKEMTAHRRDPDGGRAFFERTFATSGAVTRAIIDLPQPVIASVQGMATAAGCQLVAACDLVVASEAARFCTPGVGIGLFCTTPAVPLSRKIAPNHAMEMLVTGEPIGAVRAREIGLVNRVVAPGRELDEALALARTIATKSSHVQKIGKNAFYRQHDMSLYDALDYANKVMVDNMMVRDAEEGIGAFVEKRTPKWEDR
jgi:enoyl-CoA hydratase/carnithine racemase